MDNNEKKNVQTPKKKTLAWGLGYLFACVLSACVTITVIAFLFAITIKALCGIWLWVF